MLSACATNMIRAGVSASLVAGALALAGCADAPYFDRRDSISFSAGDALASDRVTQMVDPWPKVSGQKNIAFNGEKMQGAVERYRTNKVTPPVSATTSSASYQAQQSSAGGASSH